MTTLYRYRFGSSVLDESSSELTINGLAVDIQPQSLRLLNALLRHRGEVVSKKELEEQVWSGRLLGENVLASAITRLRSVLGESNAGLIEAIPRIGYRIAIPVQRTVVGQGYASALELAVGQPAPERPGFVLERMLGQSPAGEVWLGRNGKSGKAHVYKYAADADQLTSLKREATLAQMLHEQLGDRKDILRILDWNFESAPFFLEAEYGGEDLLAWSQVDGRLASLSLDSRLALFLQIADAVAAAHSVAVIHKDIKPANILIEPQGSGWQIRLADFGSGRLTDDQRLAALSLAEIGAAGPQTILSDDARGTAMYIAPEIWRDMPSTERSDLYSLGVLLYQLMIGDLRQPLLPGWERQLSDTLLIEEIRQATDGDPAHRTSSVAVMIANLRSLPQRHIERQRQIEAQEQAQRDRRALARERASRPWLLALIGTLFLAFGFCLYAYLNLRDSERALERQNANIEALNQFMSNDLIGQANPSLTGQSDISIKQAALLAAQKIDAPESHYSPEVHLALHVAMQENLEALENHRAAIEQAEHALGLVQGMDHPDQALLDRLRVTYARSLTNLTKLDAAEAQLDLAKASLLRPGAKASETLAWYWYARGNLAGARFRWSDRLDFNRQAGEVLAKLPYASISLKENLIARNISTNRILGKLDIAESMAREYLKTNQQRYGQAHFLTCQAGRRLAEALVALRKLSEGLPLAENMVQCMRKASGNESNFTASMYTVLGNAYLQDRQWAKSAEAYLQAAALFERLNGGAITQSLLCARINAAIARNLDGHPELAKPVLLQSLADAGRIYSSADHPVIMTARYNLANTLLDLGLWRDAGEQLAHLDAKQLNAIDPKPSWQAQINYQLGRLARMQGNKQVAIDQLESAFKQMQASDPASITLPIQKVRDELTRAQQLAS